MLNYEKPLALTGTETQREILKNFLITNQNYVLIMKKQISNFVLILLVPILFLRVSCGQKCDKPTDAGNTTITIPIKLRNSGTSCEVSGSKLLSDFNTGANIFGSSLLTDVSKWVIEVTATGQCDADKGWTELYKKKPLIIGSNPNWTPKVKTINGVDVFALEIPDIPTQRGDVAFIIDIQSPCISCSAVTSGLARTKFSKNVMALTLKPNGILEVQENDPSGNALTSCQ